ncbi:Competence protein ComM [BD1-7 clade bacterium]|uniref:Competence protein ComM n=1 Tax=BD1-7 clade bacterium TaxID=2029982 RepID=A0A5S9MS48_9GAMM|nr:Competence protein ComM [BD1-7 clade bacterium]
MSVATVYTRAVSALDAPQVNIEVHLSNGLPAFTLVGLPETAVRESKDRVRSAILNSQFEFPNKRITINLAPADLPKDGGRFDLPIALGILAASGQIPADSLHRFEFLGELALTGELRPVKGALMAAQNAESNERILILPTQNGAEAAIAVDDKHRIAGHLLEICAFLRQQGTLNTCLAPNLQPSDTQNNIDMAEIKGQHQAKRALEIAATGKHNILFSGPPGCGKSMLAERLPGILPTMTRDEALQHLAIRSLTSNSTDTRTWMQRPFRAPHHSSSAVALVGGGNPPKPGEISLAHQGVLFLDEIPEFTRNVLEALREPLESHRICISRANQQALFPARFQLIAAMNPCPCGYHGDTTNRCRCSPDQIHRYCGRLSGPLLDRIDIHIHLQPTPIEVMTRPQNAAEESSSRIRERVEQAYQRQIARQNKANGDLSGSELHQFGAFLPEATAALENMAHQLQLSARGLQRAMRLARTIADLADSEHINRAHCLEACQYRQLAAAQPATTL